MIDEEQLNMLDIQVADYVGSFTSQNMNFGRMIVWCVMHHQ